MYKVAESASDAAVPAVKATTCFPEVGNGRQLAVDGATSVPARVECITGFLSRVFVLETRVDVADEICVFRSC
jgi:hypothetical protein